MPDYSLSDSEREKAFPVHIDLGKKDQFGPASPAVPAGGKKGKARTFYPTVYIDAVPGLEDLPKEGCMLVEFRRTRLSIETPEDGKDSAGVTLELRRICLPEDGGSEGPKDLASAMDGKMDDEEDAGDDSNDETDEGE